VKEQELKEYIQTYYSTENESCEWKSFSNIKNAFSANEKDDIVSYVCALSNMNGGTLIIGVEDGTLNITGTKTAEGYTPENAKLKLVDQCTNLPSENLAIDEYITEDTAKKVWIITVPKHCARRKDSCHICQQ
jgi:ATP-dependent DNA helicase RecG